MSVKPYHRAKSLIDRAKIRLAFSASIYNVSYLSFYIYFTL